LLVPQPASNDKVASAKMRRRQSGRRVGGCSELCIDWFGSRLVSARDAAAPAAAGAIAGVRLEAV
jgi:hypothetical protein